MTSLSRSTDTASRGSEPAYYSNLYPIKLRLLVDPVLVDELVDE
jgi:hypothetical protein